MTEYQTLLAQKAELEAQIAAAQAEAKAKAVTEARALIAEHGLTAADVFPAQGKAKGSVGAPKYRDPATGATWTGRGKPPNWINGKDRAPFLISAA
ncbi:H-NS histone family protein [Delftia tsuruhatensis]|uniref:H-NS histone family protein n=1 Tax=Delftia tsuruhatensis TaxID=180282 RepID=UPI002443F2F6|nr:H-NS histone family protein [Delftia tsuruhatensis]MDH0774776.1 H-NS histone family protein [Delftia tsuruhatensis]MDH1458738.1 H-NS histone family protein [Delftia tsuruhatensis]MDH1826919.1 H-NS histone family protein [Delftia tsuruhatensis]WGG09455.1 H-NS histone family protein [Delftia tsuruhatensis]